MGLRRKNSRDIRSSKTLLVMKSDPHHCTGCFLYNFKACQLLRNLHPMAEKNWTHGNHTYGGRGHVGN
eukprot:6737776-Karenia_brevis.AAC.1